MQLDIYFLYLLFIHINNLQLTLGEKKHQSVTFENTALEIKLLLSAFLFLYSR